MLPPVFPVTFQDLPAQKTVTGLKDGQAIRLRGPGVPPQVVLDEGDLIGEPRQALWIRVLRSSAHPGGVLIYRIEWRGFVIVYATDTEGYASTDRRLARFAHGADLLIHDAQYSEEHYLGTSPYARSTQGWGHSTYRMACEVARAADVRRLALFHFDPTYTDEKVSQLEASARQIFPETFAAREGLAVSLSRGPAGRAIPLAPVEQVRAAV
jgi:ribonuclease BN (tRNA processing enzyme)